MRKKRNQALYDIAGLISKSEPRSILGHAVAFVSSVKVCIDHERTSG